MMVMMMMMPMVMRGAVWPRQQTFLNSLPWDQRLAILFTKYTVTFSDNGDHDEDDDGSGDGDDEDDNDDDGGAEGWPMARVQ